MEFTPTCIPRPVECPPEMDDLDWLIQRVHERETMREITAYLAFMDEARKPLVIQYA